MPEVPLEGQKKLKAARVLCVGAGGLGLPLTLYLAAAGVGTIGVVEFDLVDVREPHEFEIEQIPGARPVPMSELPARRDRAPEDDACSESGEAI